MIRTLFQNRIVARHNNLSARFSRVALVISVLVLPRSMEAAAAFDPKKLPGAVEYLDLEFKSGLNPASIQLIRIEEDKKILVAGNFSTINGRSHSRLVRLLPNGSVDPTFLPGPAPGGELVAWDKDSAGRILLASGTSIFRYLPSGVLDKSFIPRIAVTGSTSWHITDLRVTEGNALILAGGFGFPRVSPGLNSPVFALLKLNEDGSPASGFKMPEGSGSAVEVSGSGEILVGGQFPIKNKEFFDSGLRRLRQDGSISPDFPFIPSKARLIGTDLQGNLLALDTPSDGSRLHRFARNGNPVAVSGILLKEPVAVPPSQAVLTDGRVFSYSFGSYQIFSPDGTVQTVRLSQNPWRVNAIAISGDRLLVASGSVGMDDRLAWIQTGEVPQTPPIILSQPSLPSRTFPEGESLAISIQIGPSVSPVSIQWERDGQPIPHGKEERLFFNELRASDSGLYRAVVSNASGRVVSDSVSLVVTPADSAQFGALDLNFNAGELEPEPSYTGSIVRAVLIDEHDRIWMGGFFRKVAGTPRNSLARLLPDGSLDLSLDPGTNPGGKIHGLIKLSNGGILAYGEFERLHELPRHNLGRFEPGGSLDLKFALDPRFSRTAISEAYELSDGRLILGGTFVTPEGKTANVIRLLSDGALDETFAPGKIPESRPQVSTSYKGMAVQSDGTVVMAHSTCIGSTIGCSPTLSRLGADGTLTDLGVQFGALPMTPRIDPQIRSLHVLSDDNILVGGLFASVNNRPRRFLVRLKSDGQTVDPSFVAPTNVFWNTLAGVEPDGHSYVMVQELVPAGPIRHRLRRLQPNGSPDPRFRDVSPGGEVLNVAVQDHRILLVGTFIQINSQPRHGIASLVGLRPEKRPRLLFPSMADGQFSFSVLSQANRDYVLEYKESLDDPEWTLLSSLSGHGGTLQLSDPNPAPLRRFYRVREQVKP